MKTAVLSVVYPGLELFLPDFLSSLSRQTDTEFVLYLVNDGFAGIEQFLGREGLNQRVRDAAGTPASLRKLGINWMLEEGVEEIIFADADDTFSSNRVAVSRQLLKAHDVVCNELVLCGKNIESPIPLLESRYDEGQSITAESLISANCIGMSNSAVRANISFELDQIPDSIFPFDWALFSLIANSGFDIVFTKRAITYYRQHEDNQASPLELSDDQIVRGVKVKQEHFQLLARRHAAYGDLAESLGDLYDRLNSNGALRQKYTAEVRSQSPEHPLWWEPMKTLEELGL